MKKRSYINNFTSLLPFFCFISTYIALHAWFRTPTFAMPQLIGCQLAEATKICSSYRLRLEIIQSKADPDLPDGTIIHQIPAPKHRVKGRQTVFIVISEHSIETATPSLIGLSREEVISICARHNLKPKFYMLPYSYPTNQCFCQWPSAKMPLDGNNIICYLAAEEKKYALWPNFRGQELQKVSLALAEHGIKTDVQIPPKTGVKHFITDQQPKAGACIDLDHTNEIIAHFKTNTKRPSGAR